MGPLIDQPVTEWEEMFLPARVEAKLAELSDAQGVPLVRRRVMLFEADRGPVLEGAPAYRWGWLAIGVALGAALYGLSRLRRRWSNVALALGLGAVGTLVGILGLLLLVLWLLTDHDVAHWNQNVLLCPVWALAMPVLAVDFARKAPRSAALMMRLVAAAVVSATLALLLWILPPAGQETGPTLSLFLPLWLGAGLAVWERCGRPLPRFLAAGRGSKATATKPSPTALQP
jgi:hypothetical protein